jgi:hypothetical protein
MEHRRHRVGDTLDDYCPRERRLTTHAVVAMVEDEVKQTRCTTCDVEHVYKGGKAPVRRAARQSAAVKAATALSAPPAAAPDVEVPESTPPAAGRLIRPGPAARPTDQPSASAGASGSAASDAAGPTPPEAAIAASVPADDSAPPAGTTPRDEHEGPVHRRLIRATLPRLDNQATPRPVPEFTMRQPSSNGFSRKGANRFGFRQGGRPFGKGPQSHRGGNVASFSSRQGGSGSGQPRPHGTSGGRPGRKRSR